MSVIVKGVEIPKSCSKCGWFDMGGGDGYRCTLLRKSFDMWNKISVARDKNCPLVEIPTPHGRLIDAEKLKRHIDKLPALPDGNFAGTHRNLKALINMQKTVIEAEGSGD